MCRATFSILFMAAMLGVPCAVPAHQVAAASSAPALASGLNRPSSLEHLGSDKVARSNTILSPGKHSASSQIVPSAYRNTDRTAPSSALNRAAITPISSGWRYTAALLGTLGIIGTIAVRRRKPGKPWA